MASKVCEGQRDVERDGERQQVNLERERESAHVCVRKRKKQSMSLCHMCSKVCVRERQRVCEGETECANGLHVPRGCEDV